MERGVAAQGLSRAPVVFLDANVLFSAAIGGPAFELLLTLASEARVSLLTSRACLAEAETNLERKRPEARAALAAVLTSVSLAGDELGEHGEWAAGLVHADDVHVLAATRAAGGDVLVTGDTTHFGPLMGRDDLGLRARTPRAFPLEGPG